MKKNALVVAALAAMATTAYAQSSVEIYGIVDQAVTRGNGGTAANAGGNGTSKAWTAKQSTSSRLGFRGNEELGGGLSAQFKLDHRFAPDTGTASNAAGTFWAGASIVQLTHRDIGSVWLGRDYTPAFFVGVKSDPFGWDGVGQVGILQYANYRGEQGVQANDAVGLKTAKIAGGLTAAAMVSLGEGVRPRQTSLNVEYTAGPLYVGVGYDKLAGGTAAQDGNSLVNAAVTYNAGFIIPMVYVAQSKTAGGNDKNKMFSVGARVPMGANVVKVAYGRLDPAGADNTQQKFSLGYEYYLSKRTNIYADAGLAREENRSNNNAYALGLRHKF